MYMDQFITFLTAEADTTNIREETFMDEEHIVVPVIALIEGVIEASNATGGPELALASEFAKAPDGWDGRPIVMNHPQINGQMVSANKPKVLENWSFGMMFNTRLEDGKLKSEAWLNKSRVSELGGEVKDTVDRILAGNTVEVSTGLFTEVERAKGRFNGENYNGVWRSVVPDHLAFLSQGTAGACSVEDGCGVPRLNRALLKQTTPFTVSEGGCGCNVGGFCQCEETKMPTRELYEKACKILSNAIPDTVIDRDARRSLSDAVQREFGAFTFLIAHTQNEAIFEDMEGGLFSVKFDMDKDGVVVFSGKPKQVNLMTRIVPVKTSTPRDNASGDEEGNEPEEVSSSEEQTEENVSMADKTENGATEDANASTEDQTEETSGVEAQTETEAQTSSEASENTEVTETEEVTETAPLTAQEYISNAPPEIQEVLAAGLSAHNSRKASLITNIKASKRCDFDDDELSAMSVTSLEKMAKLSKVPVYTGNAPTVNEAPESNMAPPAPNVFPITKATNE